MSSRANENLYPIEEHPNFRGVVNDMKAEVKEFLGTRLALLRTEMKEKVGACKSGVPLILAGALLGLAAFVALNIAFLALLAQAFGATAIAWCYSALVIFVLYAAVGGGLAFAGMRAVRKTGLVPTHTIKVLKQDQDWLQREAKTQV